MTEIEKILSENLKETLRQFQSYLLWGIGSSLSFLILTVTRSNSGTIAIPLPGVFASVDLPFAKVIAVAIAWIVGALAYYQYDLAVRLLVKLQHNVELLRAILTYPSIATEYYPGVRLFAAGLPGLFIFIGLLNSRAELHLEGFSFVMLAIFLLIPYLVVAFMLLYAPLPIEKPTRSKSWNRHR